MDFSTWLMVKFLGWDPDKVIDKPADDADTKRQPVLVAASKGRDNE